MQRLKILLQVAQVFLPDEGDDHEVSAVVTSATTSTPVVASKAKPVINGELKTPVSAVKKGSRLKIRSRSPSPGGAAAVTPTVASTPSVPG